MARMSAIFFSRHCHRTIIFYFSATATCAAFLVCAGSAVALKVAQVPSTATHSPCSPLILLTTHHAHKSPLTMLTTPHLPCSLITMLTTDRANAETLKKGQKLMFWFWCGKGKCISHILFVVPFYTLSFFLSTSFLFSFHNFLPLIPSPFSLLVCITFFSLLSITFFPVTVVAHFFPFAFYHFFPLSCTLSSPCFLSFLPC